MKFVWIDTDADIGVYYLRYYYQDDNNYSEVCVRDYTGPYQSNRRHTDREYAHAHPYAFEVSYCSGFSMHRNFNWAYTLEDVKQWAEKYICQLLIHRYEDMLKEFDACKEQAEWAKEHMSKITNPLLKEEEDES